MNKTKVVLPTVIGISSFLAGLGVGYAIYRFKMRSRVVETIVKAEEPEEVQPELPFGAGYDEPVPEATVIHIEALDTVVLEEIRPDNPGDYLVNPLRGVEDDYWVYEDEIARRIPERPYVIHRDEYEANELDYTQASVMYYEGDDVVCDELDVPMYTKDQLMGPLLFGHGSLDPNIVYIRNEKIEMEWEVLRNEGHYGIDVEGLEEEPIEHSRKKPKKPKEPIRKFKLD